MSDPADSYIYARNDVYFRYLDGPWINADEPRMQFVPGTVVRGTSPGADTVNYTDGFNGADPPEYQLFSLDCMRHNQKEVANIFKDRYSAGCERAYGCNTDVHWPDELNFCFRVKVKFVNASDWIELAVGQGHSRDDQNNWWVSGAGMDKNQVVKVPNGSGAPLHFRIVGHGDAPNSFGIKTVAQ